MNILFVASEAAPLIKVGGLADVVGALPAALHALGHDVRILLPHYSLITPDRAPVGKVVARGGLTWRGEIVPVTVSESILQPIGTPLYLLAAPKIFAGGAIYYEHFGVGGMRLAEERYLFFSAAVSQLVEQLPWQPEVVHCHDWHTGAVPALLRLQPQRYPTVLTIHNMEGQGKWNAPEALSWLSIHGRKPPALSWRDVDNNLNLLQLGIRNADVVTTVSPRYAEEILTPQFGAGLENDLQARRDGVQGVVNGIDTAVFSPATDTRLVARYAADTVVVGKTINARILQKELGLPRSHGPLFGLVGRLTNQKGIDLALAGIDTIVGAGGQMVILGSGVPETEALVRAAAERHPAAVRAIIKFDALLAQRIYAAADFFLMPSRFEPCGLGQMIAMRYGAIPIVRDTGGLHDTVRDIRRHNDGTGIVFAEATTAAFCAALDTALHLYHEHDTLLATRRRAMAEDFSWQRSARRYEAVYTHAQQRQTRG